MSNLNFTDAELWEMEHRPAKQAIKRGSTIPYHLLYTQTHRNNEILNPHLPGTRKREVAPVQQLRADVKQAAAGQEGEKRDKYRMGQP